MSISNAVIVSFNFNLLFVGIVLLIRKFKAVMALYMILIKPVRIKNRHDTGELFFFCGSNVQALNIFI
jgi:hypothetical protein